MTENEFNYWAFLSYSQQDNRAPRSDAPTVSSVCWGDWLHEVLKNFSIPADFMGQVNARGEIIPEKIHPIFQDDQESPTNATLSAETRQALTQSRCLIVICSPRSARSLHVNEAVRYFKQLGRGNRILPIIVAGEPNVSDRSQPGASSADECFVPALRHPLNVDGTLDTMRRDRGSIFADARHGNDQREILAQNDDSAEAGLEICKIKLIAGLIGVGFNGLWSREQQRRFTGFAKAEHQTRVALSELSEARNQIRAVQNQLLEKQNLPPDIHRQIQDAQNQAHETRRQLEELQAAARDTQSQLAETRQQVHAAEGKVLEAQQQARDARQQLEAARHEARAAQNQALEAQNLSPDLQRQIQETQNQFQAAQQSARAAQSQIQVFQNQVRDTQSQLEAVRNQVREAEAQVATAQQQARDAQEKVQAIQNQTRDVQIQIQAAQEKTLAAQRLAKVMAFLAVLAALASGIAEWQRSSARPTLGEISATPSSPPVAAGLADERQRTQSLEQLPSRFDEVNSLPTSTNASTLETKNVDANAANDAIFQHQLTVLVSWVKTDLPAAITWVENLPPGNKKNLAQSSLAEIWTQTDANGLGTFALGLPPGEAQTFYLTTACCQLARRDLPGAVELLQPFPAGELKQNILEQAGRSCDWPQINSAAKFISTLPAGDDQKALINGMLSKWSATEPESAINWLRTFPETNPQTERVQSVIQAWSQTEPAAVAKWLATLPPEAANDETINAFITGAVAQYPEFAAQWTQSVTGETRRQKFQAEVARLWMKTDSAAATKWLDELNLREAIKQR